MAQEQASVWRCEECGHRWIPRAEGIPERCAKHTCKSRHWHQTKTVAELIREKNWQDQIVEKLMPRLSEIVREMIMERTF